MSNNGPVAWPVRSPDLLPLDFYLLGWAKNEIYEFDLPENWEILKGTVWNIFYTINPKMFRRVVSKYYQNCHSVNGRNFIHLNIRASKKVLQQGIIFFETNEFIIIKFYGDEWDCIK